MGQQRFEPPPYPHDRLAPIIEHVRGKYQAPLDLSIGTPCDRPPEFVMDALVEPDLAKGYPPSTGDPAFRAAVVDWFGDHLGVVITDDQVGVCVGTKELVAGVPHWLRLREPERDTVLYPEVSYPTYAMGARLAGCRAVPVRLMANGSLDLESVSPADADRALCIWSNSPANPTGMLDDLGSVAEWGRSRGVPVFSDECYLEFTWSGTDSATGPGAGETVVASGTKGVVSVNSLSKRSNLAGLRAGFYVGDEELVSYLNEIRKHAGLMVPGPVQRAAAVALGDQEHVDDQRRRYVERLEYLVDVLRRYGLDVSMPDGGFYLWIDAGDEGGWSLTERLADDLGVITSPGEFYGPTATRFVRVAAVQPMEALRAISDRM